jgi:DNA adenine methylase
MAQTPSPLRYPGGKTAITNMVAEIIDHNNLRDYDYCEPYAGGGGLALSLLFSDKVSSIYLNDLDRSVWCVWDAILNNTDEFIEKIISTAVTIDEWYIQREIQQNKSSASNFDLAFSTFFLNRTNRSGIILKAGVIGGFSQSGKYKLDCRFNKQGLIKKIIRIKDYSSRINISNSDAVDFMQRVSTESHLKPFFCIDPPYFTKGASLYTDFYEASDHQQLSSVISDLKDPWFLTYDNHSRIRELYKQFRNFTFSLNYSAAEKKKGTELFIPSDNLEIPELTILVAA